MNLISIVLVIVLAGLIGWAAVRTWKNKGKKCCGCSGDCSRCHKL